MSKLGKVLRFDDLHAEGAKVFQLEPGLDAVLVEEVRAFTRQLQHLVIRSEIIRTYHTSRVFLVFLHVVSRAENGVVNSIDEGVGRRASRLIKSDEFFLVRWR